jgi:Na+/proline symporter
MQLDRLDWAVVALYGLIALTVGLLFTRRAGKGVQEFFLSGRKLPWWLLGTSMVATTFSTDTPNLVTDLVRSGGVSQNWLWWAFLITGMLTVFVYAKLWRRSGVLTDIEFYELRYSGKPAAFLRGFRALYLGVFFNVMIMATVTLAAIKIGNVLLGADKVTTVLLAGGVTVIYSATAGLWGVVVTDLLLFALAMVGSIAAAYYALNLPEVGGLSGMVQHPALEGKLGLLPDFSNGTTVLAVLVVPIAVQWWSTWYPGAEPGGGGYVAQRMLAARTERDSLLGTLWLTERDSLLGTLWFNIAHYALRPWPWVIVALCSLIVYPSLDSIVVRFPNLDPSIVRHDLAYPAMLIFLPHGLLGLAVASLAAAYMSTISTHLNWGSSYIVSDFYRRFVAPDKSDKHYVLVGRVSTVLLIVLASLVALRLENALQAFQILLQVGAGTGLIFLLRWFWWRVNAWSEITAITVSFLVAVYFQFVHEALGFVPLDPSLTLVIGVAITTLTWIGVTFTTPPTDRATLQSFYDLIHPMGRGWEAVVETDPSARKGGLSAGLLCWFLGCVVVYSALFGTGYFLYGNLLAAAASFLILALAAGSLFKVFPRVGLIN